MKLEDCIKRIDRYMYSTDNHPRLVNVRNQEDMKSIYTHFKVGVNIFKDVSDYARNDENPSEAALFDDLRKLTGTIFVTGFTTFYKMIGEQKLRELLNKLVALTNAKLKIVVLCYQCEKFLAFSDSRYRTWVYDVKGITSTKPNLVFVSPEMPDLNSTQSIEGIQNIPFFIEQNKCDEVHVKTAKTKNNYNHSLFDISEQTKLFDLLLQIDPITNSLKESYGTDEQWKKAMTEIKASSWAEYIRKSFGAVETLHLALPDWNSAKDYTKWLYFIALKLYGTPNNAYMNMAVESANSVEEIVKCFYQCILEVPCSDKEYWELYEERKALLKKLCCNDSKQIADYCDWVMEKESKTLYYLTDATKKEINLIFEMIEKYADDYSKDELLGVLKHISSDLYLYLQNYDYKHELLNDYFSDYKYQKVTNKITTEFREFVEKQAVDREYLRILPARSEKTESIDMQNTAVYFVDAMGVEYMAYIMSLCREFNLMTYTTLCHCELPSITSKNKDFVEVFENHGGVFIPDKNGIKALDEMKHHGTDNFDFVNNHLPTYLYDELKVIRKVLEEVNSKLQKYDRVVLISDHGASRLSVISGQENKHEMNEKGIHSGRCCPKSEADEKPSCAIDGEDFWVLANYDRFKGSRPANIEVHGGATLEEVVVPIIEITRPAAIYEFKMSTPKIEYSKRKKNAQIKVYSKIKLDEISVAISGNNQRIIAHANDGHNFTIALPDLKPSKKPYQVDVYIQDNLIMEGLSFEAENKDFKEKTLL